MKIFARTTALLAMVLALASGLVQADQRPEVASRVVAFSGEQGVKVWTLRIGARGDNQALVQVEGVDHDWDMRIERMAVEKNAGDTRYSTQVDGKKFVVLLVRNGWGELYLPGEAKPLMVGYDNGLSEQGNAQAFLTDYLQAR
ncbi:hypothetical protein BVH01_01820 [Pseudomonas sp. PA1(2017)]|uniref:hypothetical protein n=1 Tax=Pseudomonas sp. PA1(2017) TaxID=1932113 RepID=UPI00095BE402|nr:hypothetical protein [Pseudomonas sp. PA1(2017)]OLU20701.1 hypothetical protein BVH01_01820 [Pseudomonas sp. PA1(2017)]